MMQCPYGQEPADGKLLLLRLLGKWKTILLAALLGALLCGGLYYLVKVPLGPAKKYEAVTDVYVEYALQENGEEHTYFNQVTWNQLVKEDLFTETLSEKSGQTPAFIEEAVSATLSSDTRIVTTTVVTTDPELTMVINRALIDTLFVFGEQQKEIASMTLFKEPAEATPVKPDIRVFRAAVTGLVCFLFVTLLYLCLYFIWDDSLWIPESVEKRYAIPCLGTEKSPEYDTLVKKYFGEGSYDTLPVAKEEDPETAKNLLEGSAPVLLQIPAGAHNGKAVEHMLALCKKCDREVRAAVLTEADETLLAAYRRCEHPFKARKKN